MHNIAHHKKSPPFERAFLMAIIECRASQAEPNMSCLAGKGGKLEATGGWTAGLLKEAYDLTKKSVSSETRKRYGGIGNIFKDSAKDIVNNWKGLHYGLENRGKCINLLERKLP